MSQECSVYLNVRRRPVSGRRTRSNSVRVARGFSVRKSGQRPAVNAPEESFFVGLEMHHGSKLPDQFDVLRFQQDPAPVVMMAPRLPANSWSASVSASRNASSP